MQKRTKLKIQSIVLSLALMISCICEPVSIVHANDPIKLENTFEKKETYNTNFMVFKDVMNDDLLLKPMLEAPKEVTEDMIEEPVVEEVKVEVETKEEPKVVEKPKAEVKKETKKEESKSVELSLSDVDLIALVVMAEAEGEPTEGKRLVVDVILNRVDSGKFPNSVKGVIYQKGQFEAMWNGRVDRCEVRDDIRKLVEEEMSSRTNSRVLYFRTNHYHNFGTPELSVGNHYFSS